MRLITPKTNAEFTQYYHLRWRILRKPWGQAEGSERDDMDDKGEEFCHHLAAVKKQKIIGVARLEFPTKETAQLRYMAIDNLYQKQGIGRRIVQHMEQYAVQKKSQVLFLNARENALGFYEKLGYEITGKSYLLFDSIQHYKMSKTLIL